VKVMSPHARSRSESAPGPRQWQTARGRRWHHDGARARRFTPSSNVNARKLEPGSRAGATSDPASWPPAALAGAFKPEARHGKIGRDPLRRVPTGMGLGPSRGLKASHLAPLNTGGMRSPLAYLGQLRRHDEQSGAIVKYPLL